MTPPVWHRQLLRLTILIGALILTLTLLVAGYCLQALAFSAFAWGVFLMGTLRPGCEWFGPGLSKLPATAPSVYLTIDDGPDPETTPRLVQLLAEYGASATFFLIGERAAAHPDLVKLIAKSGHGIGNHSLTHPRGSFWACGPWRVWREIAGCQKLLSALLAAPPTLFRSPVGHTNPFVHPALEALGLTRVAWSARGYDGILTSVSAVLTRIEPDLGPGAIVLLHDATPIAPQMLQAVLESLKLRQLAAIRLPESHPDAEFVAPAAV